LGELPGLTRKTTKRNSRPGQHGEQPRKPSEYAIRLEEKQKLKFNYGVTEKQLLRYVRDARRIKGSTGEALLQLLEMRLEIGRRGLQFYQLLLLYRCSRWSIFHYNYLPCIVCQQG
jgi:ribosomal protein S4